MARFERSLQIPGMTREQLFTHLSQFAKVMSGRLSIISLKVTQDIGSHSFEISGQSVQIQINCLDGSVEVQGNLGLLALPFKGKINEELDEWVVQMIQSLKKPEL